MEAMWMRYMPVMLKVKYWLAANKIGEICTMSADFGFLPKDTSPIKRLYNKELAGGALLDIGIYPLTLAFMVFGKKPRKILAEAVLGRGGVDEQTAMILSYENGAMARLFCSIRVGTPCEAVICGTKGSIVIHSPFWHGGSATLSVNDEKSITVTGDTGFYFEAADAMQCLKKGHLESSLVPLSESLAITECMDEVRQQIGLQYPADQSNAAEKLDKPGTKTYSHDQAWN
jgi:predicted dehydrogenase